MISDDAFAIMVMNTYNDLCSNYGEVDKDNIFVAAVERVNYVIEGIDFES